MRIIRTLLVAGSAAMLSAGLALGGTRGQRQHAHRDSTRSEGHGN